ncbi:cell division control protein 2 [Dorcoceras hygrometricum]|uniref:Cell division control protein 2 n=1 Tax=Dorcoceras hygrometricum TaxID=472368 RepID=A0A2Z7CU57_9LAMI|nr:cell division control protein 2 [Dorcoceras hygrometricum]
MASVFITNALQVYFDSLLGIQDNEEMVNMFRALEASGLRGFLGCPSVLYEQELEQFFDTAMVQDGDVTCAVSGKFFAISEARTVFSKSEKPVQYSCEKRLLKYEFRLLNDILAKSITVKAGSFDVVTHERFLMMTAIHFGVKINWSKILFEILKEMADRTIKRAKGFAAQICTVNTYVATNKTIDSRGESDEPPVDKVAIVKRKSVSKKKSAPNDKKDADEEPVEVVEKVVSKKRSDSTAERSHAQKRKAPKRKLRLSAGSDDEIVTKEPAVENVLLQQKATTSIDDVDNIVLRVIAETTQMESYVVEPGVAEGIATGTDLAEPMEPRSEDITVEISEESMSIEDLLLQIPGDAMLPSVFVDEPTKIKFGLGIQNPGVTEMDQYKASLPQIIATDKGKEPLVVETIQGHPAREIFSLICADIEFLIQLREQAIAAKEKKVLNWGETDSVKIALQRRVYIVAKYRELLLRKFLEARRQNFVSGTPTTAIDLKVLELLTASHHFSVKVLMRQVKEHKLEWTRPSNSLLFEGDNIDRGYFIPRDHRTIFSTRWIRTKMLVNGSWLIVEGVYYWRPIMRPVDSRNLELLPQRPYIDDLAPLCAFIEPVQDIDSRAPFSKIVRDLWAEVYIEEIPTGFRVLFQRGLNTNSFATFLDDFVEHPEEQVLPEDESSSSDDSVVYCSPSLDAEPSV